MCMFVCLRVGPFVCLLAFMLACLHACLLARLLVCLCVCFGVLRWVQSNSDGIEFCIVKDCQLAK